MAKKIKIIGIGAGDPDHVTVQAVEALNQVDAFFLMDKGAAKEKLVALRREICERHIRNRTYRFVDATSPERVREGDYHAAVAELNDRKQDLFERLIEQELRDGECGAFLVWGDPSLYDSTIRIVEAIASSGRHQFDWEVIPGISSVQALAARHRTTLNTIGKALAITPGRHLAGGFPDSVDSVVVMLDADNAYKDVPHSEDIDIFWGAYVGTPDEILVAGKLKDVMGDIERLRSEARRANGWIMDSYILRRRGGEGGE